MPTIPLHPPQPPQADNDITMSNTTPTTTTPPPPLKTRELTTTTIKTPPFSYLHLSTSTSPTTTTSLDALQVRSYCASACRQFLGTTGAAIPVDVLSITSGGGDAWVRVPRGDLGAFAGAITAYGGTSSEGGGVMVMRVEACGDWLGSLVGGEGEGGVWGSSS